MKKRPATCARFEAPFLYCAEGASFSATPGFQRLVLVCPMSAPKFTSSISLSGDGVSLSGVDMRRLHPVFPLVAFQLGFSGMPEFMKKMRNHQLMNSPAGLRFETLFCHFLGRVQPLVLARRTRSDFGAILPGGSI